MASKSWVTRALNVLITGIIGAIITYITVKFLVAKSKLALVLPLLYGGYLTIYRYIIKHQAPYIELL